MFVLQVEQRSTNSLSLAGVNRLCKQPILQSESLFFNLFFFNTATDRERSHPRLELLWKINASAPADSVSASQGYSGKCRLRIDVAPTSNHTKLRRIKRVKLFVSERVS